MGYEKVLSGQTTVKRRTWVDFHKAIYILLIMKSASMDVTSIRHFFKIAALISCFNGRLDCFWHSAKNCLKKIARKT